MTILAWHWTRERNGVPILRTGRPVPPIGEWLVHEGLVCMCAVGLHASLRCADALHYAPGLWCHRVEVEDVVEEIDDKLVCRRRRRVASWRVPAAVIEQWARECSELARWFAADAVRADAVRVADIFAAASRFARAADDVGAADDAARATAVYAAAAVYAASAVGVATYARECIEARLVALVTGKS